MTAPDLTPEVLEELTRLVAAVDQSPVATMRETSINLTRALWLHRHALLAAAQRVQELEGVIRADEHRLNNAAVEVWGENVHGCDAPEWLADEILGLRAKVAELEGDREGLRRCAEEIVAVWRELDGSRSSMTVMARSRFANLARALGQPVDPWTADEIDAARQADTEEG